MRKGRQPRGSSPPSGILLLLAGAKGAVGSTVAVAVAALRSSPERVLPSLTTGSILPQLGPVGELELAGWDVSPSSLMQSLARHRVLPADLWGPHEGLLGRFEIRDAPPETLGLEERVERLLGDIEALRRRHPHHCPVLVNLLPACGQVDLGRFERMQDLYHGAGLLAVPDLAYSVAAVLAAVPVVNFTSNPIEAPAIVREAEIRGVPMAGRDGKTGETYFKVVLASALRARNLKVDGWYSLNILGNEDGRNLADPHRARGKLANKTEVLEGVLGYKVGEGWDAPSHKVHIDYYPPRGDAKEAWDVVDFTGLFGMPMSLRVNLMARDSVLAAPLVIDLARWVVALKHEGRGGLVPELAFYFKRPLGKDPPLRFQDQLSALEALERALGPRHEKADSGRGRDPR